MINYDTSFLMVGIKNIIRQQHGWLENLYKIVIWHKSKYNNNMDKYIHTQEVDGYIGNILIYGVKF